MVPWTPGRRLRQGILQWHHWDGGVLLFCLVLVYRQDCDGQMNRLLIHISIIIIIIIDYYCCCCYYCYYYCYYIGYRSHVFLPPPEFGRADVITPGYSTHNCQCLWNELSKRKAYFEYIGAVIHETIRFTGARSRRRGSSCFFTVTVVYGYYSRFVICCLSRLHSDNDLHYPSFQYCIVDINVVWLVSKNIVFFSIYSGMVWHVEWR